MDGIGSEQPVALPLWQRSCPHCRCAQLRSWGMTGRGLRRLRCGGCRRTFSETTGRPGIRSRRPEALDAVLDDMLGPEPSSCRVLAARLGVHHMTVWRWRIRLLARFRGALALRDEAPARPQDGGQEDGAVFARESRKASREWVNHARWPAVFPPPPRPRWRDLAPGEAPPGGWGAWRVTARLGMGRGEDRKAGLQDRFERFLAPFRGPATRHLGGYVAWMGLRAALEAA